MDQFVWVFGLLWPALVLSVLAMMTLFDEASRVVLAAVAMVFWIVFSLEGGNITVVDNGTTVAETYPAMVILGALMAFIMAIFVFWRAPKLLGELRGSI